jgi:carbon-monoxide dehydrogenase large subunit
MKAQHSADALAQMKFAVGQPVPRSEDQRLLKGEGRYTADIDLPQQLHAVVVRSTHAHGVIRGLDSAEARKLPGVQAIFTGADLAAADYAGLDCILNFQNRDGTPIRKAPRPALTSDRVRFVGDPVAFVVAETLMQARRAAEAVVVDIEPLPAVFDAREASQPGAPVLYDSVPGNIVLDYHYGDVEKVAAAFQRAAHVTRLRLINNRIIVNSMEPRGALATYDRSDGRWTLRVGCQGVMMLRAQLSTVMRVPPEKLRIITHNVGGSFGMKSFVYPEYICVLHAARALERPIKWLNDRSESFLSDQHGRCHEVVAELALDAEGQFLAVRVNGFGNFGAYIGAVAPMMPTFTTMRNIIGPYRTPLVEVSSKCVLTTTPPVSSYRGAGRPEAQYYMERLVQAAAAEMNIDPVEIRRRNHVAPDQFPYEAPSGAVYDSGEFTKVMEKAIEIAAWHDFPQRKADSRARGKLRGRGLSSFLESTAVPRTKEMGGIRFEADGTVTIITGTLDYGQGHATPFAQVLSARLGIPFEAVRLLQGDSDALLVGAGTGGSKSLMQSGSAIVEASDKVIENGLRIAAHVLEASETDIEFKDGRFGIVGTDRGIDIMDLVARIHGGLQLPEDSPQSLDVKHVSDTPPATYPNGCHVVEVEIDPETGKTEIVNYLSVDDFGNVVNPLLVQGQVHGGVVQGIGQALMEEACFDSAGQPLTGSFMDYAVPRAHDVPNIVTACHPVPAKTNVLGVKGCGEAGCTGALAAVMNAVVDALAEFGIRHIDMPATPNRVWEAIREVQAAAREEPSPNGKL